jgi:hypothetical protein
MAASNRPDIRNAGDLHDKALTKQSGTTHAGLLLWRALGRAAGRVLGQRAHELVLGGFTAEKLGRVRACARACLKRTADSALGAAESALTALLTVGITANQKHACKHGGEGHTRRCSASRSEGSSAGAGGGAAGAGPATPALPREVSRLNNTEPNCETKRDLQNTKHELSTMGSERGTNDRQHT